MSTPTKPKTVKEGKAFVNSNIGKRYADGKKTYEITGITNEGEVSIKVTDKIGKSSETTLKLSGTLTNIFGTKKKNAAWSEVEATDLAKKSPNRTETTAKTPKTEQNTPKMEVADKKTARVDEGAKPKTETKPTITPVEAMKKLGTLGAADVDTLTKALAREERAGHTERANMIRVLRDYKRGVGTNSNPQSDETSGGKYRASVEAAKPLDDPAFVAWAKKRGVAPTTQKRNEYDKAMADTLTNRLSRWIKGVTVKRVNAIAPDEGGDARNMALIGKRDDGIEVYESNADVRKLPFNDRVKKFVDLMRNEYAGRTARFTKDGKTYYATFDKGGIDKNAYGDNQSDAAGRDAKINTGASGDIFDLVENAQYSSSKPESGKTSKMHKNVKTWDYFVKTVQIDGEMFDVLVNVRDKGDNQFVYNVALRSNKKLQANGRLHDHEGLTSGAIGLTKGSISQLGGVGKGSYVRPLHDGERIVGSYNRATGEVQLAKGASVGTVLHELGWHAARHWAEVNADSDPKAANLLKQMKEYAESAPKEIKDAVRDIYGDLDADTLLDEIGAARFARTGSDTVATVNYHSSGSL